MTFLFILIITTFQICRSAYTLTKHSPVSLGSTLVSANQVFELGFFTPGNSTSRYIGIWYRNVIERNIVWVANRQNPLRASDTNASLTIGNDGNLIILDGERKTVWSTNLTVQVNQTVAQLTDTGDFSLNDISSGSSLWRSYDYPGNSLLGGMMLGTNGKTQGRKQLMTSWKSNDDPTPGDFTVGISVEKPPQSFIWRDSKSYWRSGPWDGGRFIGVPEMDPEFPNFMSLIPENSQGGGAYLMINPKSVFYMSWLYLTPEGVIRLYYLLEGNNMWNVSWEVPADPCDVYGVCGASAICTNKSPICECLKGFVPQSNDEWGKGNWTGGCVRRSELLCEKNETSLASGKNNKPDKFRVIKGAKLPDHYQNFPYMSSDACHQRCSSNCSCKAYAFVTGIYCMVWTEELMDIKQFPRGGENLFLRIAYVDSGDETKGAAVLISLTTIGGVLLLGSFVFCLFRWTTYKKERKTKLNNFNSKDGTVLRAISQEDVLKQETFELRMYEFKQIITSTNNFSDTNKLGEGGFGPVYKGMLDGQQIAVKRLSVDSGQGVEEFRNEIVLISKLQHRNLVKLLGCCIKRKERLLIYEYMTNKSLDTFLFDPRKRAQLDWETRFNIIQGIGRGLIYLHHDSCLRIIHRDLKCSNILLDDNMNPKISDFGLARTFRMTQDLAKTRRIVGTYGYMSPEYAMRGVISEKSDVFSYGVMLLEILSGKRNTDFIHQEQIYPLAHAWKSWSEGRGIELMDQMLTNSCSLPEALRCIHVGLLCVQDLPTDRPTMTEAVAMLAGETNLQEPKEPLFTLQRYSATGSEQGSKNMCSINEVTISIAVGR